MKHRVSGVWRTGTPMRQTKGNASALLGMKIQKDLRKAKRIIRLCRRMIYGGHASADDMAKLERLCKELRI